MYTDPQIVHEDSCKQRSYVKVYIGGQRLRLYNGKLLGLHCFPNETKNPAERLRLLEHLRYELKKNLEKGWRPGDVGTQPKPATTLTVQQCILAVIAESKNEELSERYKADMERIGSAFISFLTGKNLTRLKFTHLTVQHLEDFLQNYSSSAVYYMTQRSNLAGLFTRFIRKGWLHTNLAYQTTSKRKVPQLNAVYNRQQLQDILSYLEDNYPKLYLCALLMYGCFLRPRREIRLLKREHISDDLSKISLGGNENKGKRIRTVHLPHYVVRALIDANVTSLSSELNVFTRSASPFGIDYFKTLWTRAKSSLLKKGLLTGKHTLYSFRHTGAVNLYLKTKDLYKVQQALGHADMTITLTYLRSLGVVHSISEDDVPDL